MSYILVSIPGIKEYVRVSESKETIILNSGLCKERSYLGAEGVVGGEGSCIPQKVKSFNGQGCLYISAGKVLSK